VNNEYLDFLDGKIKLRLWSLIQNIKSFLAFDADLPFLHALLGRPSLLVVYCAPGRICLVVVHA
jgi:hypothetical protein